MLLNGYSPDEAKQIADVLRLAVSEYRLVWDEREYGVSVSIGLAQLIPSRETVDDILAAADTACRAAKKAGGNAVYQATN